MSGEKCANHEFWTMIASRNLYCCLGRGRIVWPIWNSNIFIFLYWQKLTKGSDSWSLGELVHALVILSHYHAISSFVFGVGIGDGEDEPPCCCPSIAHKSAITTATASVPSGNSSSGQSTPTSASPPLTNGGGGSPLVLATREIVTAPTTSAATGTSALGGFYFLNLISFTR